MPFWNEQQSSCGKSSTMLLRSLPSMLSYLKREAPKARSNLPLPSVVALSASSGPRLSCVSTGTPVATSKLTPVKVDLKGNVPADEAIAEFSNVNASSESAEKCATCAAANGPPCEESVTPSPP